MDEGALVFRHRRVQEFGMELKEDLDQPFERIPLRLFPLQTVNRSAECVPRIYLLE